MKKIKCALIGPGNIGTDLLYKLQRSEFLEPVWMVGIDPSSEGLTRAASIGLKTTAEGVDGLLPHVLADNIQIAFDATSAYVHAENSAKLNALGVLMIDLTPAAIGPFCVPPVNLSQHVGSGEMNVNMVTCGGQATIPMVEILIRSAVMLFVLAKWGTKMAQRRIMITQTSPIPPFSSKRFIVNPLPTGVPPPNIAQESLPSAKTQPKSDCSASHRHGHTFQGLPGAHSRPLICRFHRPPNGTKCHKSHASLRHRCRVLAHPTTSP